MNVGTQTGTYEIKIWETSERNTGYIFNCKDMHICRLEYTKDMKFKWKTWRPGQRLKMCRDTQVDSIIGKMYI